MHRSRRLALLCLAAPLWLSACASITPTRSFDAGEAARNEQYTGRFAANYTRYGRSEGVQGSFRWEEQGRNVRLDLISPLGQTLAVVTSTPSGATLDLPNEKPRNAPEVDSLMEQALAWVGSGVAVQLGVIHFNARAIAFYKKWGFEDTGRIVGRHQIPRTLMVRPAAASGTESRRK